MLKAWSFVWLALPAFCFAQGDALVAKNIERVIADQSLVWAIADSGTSYSRINLFATPPEITTRKIEEGVGINFGIGRSKSLLYGGNYPLNDSSLVSGLGSLDRENGNTYDSLIFRSPNGTTGAAAGVRFTALAIWRDTAIVGGGRAGLAQFKLQPEGKSPLADTAWNFTALLKGKDTVVNSISCKPSKTCLTAPLLGLDKPAGSLDSVISLAVDSIASDTATIWIGTQNGLRKGRVGGTVFTPVLLPGIDPKNSIAIKKIVINSAQSLIWVFSSDRYFVSTNHGLTFGIPPDQSGIATKPSTITGFRTAPEAVIVGDSTLINFSIERPGLIVFQGDKILKNKGNGDPFDVLLDQEDSLAISREEISRLTSLAVVERSGKKIIIVGSEGKGLFYHTQGAGNAWLNINRQKAVKNSLGEVITYPTLFTAARTGGEPDWVHIGYRLKKDGKVTITVFNYAMEKVKVITRNAPRKGGQNRSEIPNEDRWDGRDSSGRLVSVGTYYIRVESSTGEGGWGKAIAVAGRK